MKKRIRMKGLSCVFHNVAKFLCSCELTQITYVPLDRKFIRIFTFTKILLNDTVNKFLKSSYNTRAVILNDYRIYSIFGADFCITYEYYN